MSNPEFWLYGALIIGALAIVAWHIVTAKPEPYLLNTTPVRAVSVKIDLVEVVGLHRYQGRLGDGRRFTATGNTTQTPALRPGIACLTGDTLRQGDALYSFEVRR